MRYIDLIFFKIYRFYERKKDLPMVSSEAFICLLWLAIGFFAVGLVNVVTGNLISGQFLPKQELKYSFYAIGILIYVLNRIRYRRKGKIEALREQFSDDLLFNRVKTWQVFILPVLIFAATVFMLVLASKYLWVFFY